LLDLLAAATVAAAIRAARICHDFADYAGPALPPERKPPPVLNSSSSGQGRSCDLIGDRNRRNLRERVKLDNRPPAPDRKRIKLYQNTSAGTNETSVIHSVQTLGPDLLR
jgi:hypothetical protein